jgi:glycosyltransferase involved in cell wall biosynthesis
MMRDGMGSIDAIVPCYQHGRYLRQCVESVLDQGVPELRVLIIDNASTDDSVSTARALAAEDSRIEVVANPVNRGPHASFNRGIDWASAKYLTILCADDMLAPGALRSAAAYLDMHPEVGVAYGIDLEFRDGEPFPPRASIYAGATWSACDGLAFVEDLCRQPVSFLALGSMLVRTAVQKRVGHYRPELPYTDDLEMILRLAAACRIAHTNRIQGFRRLHSSNLSAQHLTSRLADLQHRRAAFRSFFSCLGGSARASRLLALAERKFAEMAYWWSAQEMARGNLAAAAELLGFAVRTDAGAILHLPLSLVSKAASRALRPARRAPSTAPLSGLMRR